MNSTNPIKIQPAAFGKTPDGKGTIQGTVHSILDIATKTGTKKILVSVGDIICKLFGETAQEFTEKQSNYEGKQAEFYGRWDTSRPGRKEFIIDGAYRKPESFTFGPVTSSGLIESIQQQMHQFVTLDESERKQIVEAIAAGREQKAGLASLSDFPRADKSPMLYGHGFGRKELENGIDPKIKVEPTPEPIASEKKAEPATETIIAPKTAPAEEVVVEKTPEVQGTISNIKSTPTQDGRKMIILKIGPHNCWLSGKAAEFVENNAAQYEGNLVAVYGDWKINQRGRQEFVPTENIPAAKSDPASAMTADEVQKELEIALFEGSGLHSVGGPTFEEMEAEYKAREERKRSEQQAVSSALAF